MTEPITSDELAAMRACWAASTPGTWMHEEGYSVVHQGEDGWVHTWLMLADCREAHMGDRTFLPPDKRETNAAFIANAHQYVPRLLDEVERLRDQLFHAGCDLNILWGGIQGRDEEIARLQAQLAVKDGAGMRLIEYIVPQQEEIDLLRQRVAELEVTQTTVPQPYLDLVTLEEAQLSAAPEWMFSQTRRAVQRCKECGHNPNTHYTDGEPMV